MPAQHSAHAGVLLWSAPGADFRGVERTALGQVAKRGVQLAVQVRAAGCQHRSADARAVDVRRQHDLQVHVWRVRTRGILQWAAQYHYMRIDWGHAREAEHRHKSGLCGRCA